MNQGNLSPNHLRPFTPGITLDLTAKTQYWQSSVIPRIPQRIGDTLCGQQIVVEIYRALTTSQKDAV